MRRPTTASTQAPEPASCWGSRTEPLEVLVAATAFERGAERADLDGQLRRAAPVGKLEPVGARVSGGVYPADDLVVGRASGDAAATSVKLSLGNRLESLIDLRFTGVTRPG